MTDFASAPLTPGELMRAADAALRRRLPQTSGFMGIESIDPAKNRGSVFVLEDAKLITRRFGFTVTADGTFTLQSVTGVTLLTPKTREEVTDMSDNKYAPPDPYAEPIIALRNAAAAPTDSDIVAAKLEANAKQRHATEVAWAVAHMAASEREAQRKTIVDEAKLKAAQEMGCSVNELVLVETDDEPIPPPPDGYEAGLKTMQATALQVKALKEAGR